jgi:hypothetical protein
MTNENSKSQTLFDESDISVGMYCYNIEVDFYLEAESFEAQITFSYEKGWRNSSFTRLQHMSAEVEEGIQELLLTKLARNADTDKALSQIDEALPTISEALYKEPLE